MLHLKQVCLQLQRQAPNETLLEEYFIEGLSSLINQVITIQPQVRFISGKGVAVLKTDGSLSLYNGGQSIKILQRVRYICFPSNLSKLTERMLTVLTVDNKIVYPFNPEMVPVQLDNVRGHELDNPIQIEAAVPGILYVLSSTGQLSMILLGISIPLMEDVQQFKSYTNVTGMKTSITILDNKGLVTTGSIEYLDIDPTIRNINTYESLNYPEFVELSSDSIAKSITGETYIIGLSSIGPPSNTVIFKNDISQTLLLKKTGRLIRYSSKSIGTVDIDDFDIHQNEMALLTVNHVTILDGPEYNNIKTQFSIL